MGEGKVENEKWIVTIKEINLGYCKETFRAGAVIELDEANGRLIIDGRRFNDTRDLDILKRQAERNPDNPWVIPYSKEARAEIVQALRPKPISQAKQLRPDQKLQVVQSDEDLSEEIDISSTKISKINTAAKTAAQQRVKNNGMEIIRGDESVEERLARLKGLNDISSIAERARLKASGSTKMAIVHDDSLGAGFGGKHTISRNAGDHIPSREEADARKEDAMAKAEGYKKDAEMKRRARGAVEGDEQDLVDVSDSPVPTTRVPAEEAPAEAPSAREVALAQENSDLKARMDKIEKMMAQQSATAPRRGKKVSTGGEG
jgi:hypothetical protein